MVDGIEGTLVLQVLSSPDDDAEYLDELTGLLQEDLLELDVASVEPMMGKPAPDGSKGALAAVGGWLAVHLGSAGVKGVINAIAAWAGRTGKTVEVTLDGNTLKLTGANADLQARIVDEFLARRPSSGSG